MGNAQGQLVSVLSPLGLVLSLAKIFVCGVCGCTVEGEAPEKCPICGAPKSKFSEIE